MRANVTYNERPDSVEISTMENGLVLLYMRQDIQEKETEQETFTKTGKVKIETITQYTADEAYMILDPADAPTVEDVQESFDEWFSYAAAWAPAKVKTLAEIQADIEFIAAMSGIDLEV